MCHRLLSEILTTLGAFRPLLTLILALLPLVVPPAVAQTSPQQSFPTEAELIAKKLPSEIYSVGDPTDPSLPIAHITSPATDAELTYPSDILGSASAPKLADYQLVLRPSGSGNAGWVEIGRGSQSIDNGKLGRLDTSHLANGLYDLGLIVTDANGHQSSETVPIEISGNLKIIVDPNFQTAN